MFAVSLSPTFQQIPYGTLVARIDSGSQGLYELSTFLVERKDLEEKSIIFSAKVSRSNLYEHEIRNSSSERMMGFFKNYYLYLSKSQVKYHKELGGDVIKELEEVKVNRASYVNRHKVIVQNSIKEVTAAEDALDKAKKNYLKAKADFERAKEKLATLESAVMESNRLLEERKREANGRESNSKWKMFSSAFESTPEQERDKQFKKVERRHAELVMCMGQIIEKKNLLMDRISNMDNVLQRVSRMFFDH
jgi:hypothetical protein